MTNSEREAIRTAATQNAETTWLKNINPHDPRDVKHTIYNDDYKAGGGKN